MARSARLDASRGTADGYSRPLAKLPFLPSRDNEDDFQRVWIDYDDPAVRQQEIAIAFISGDELDNAWRQRLQLDRSRDSHADVHVKVHVVNRFSFCFGYDLLDLRLLLDRHIDAACRFVRRLVWSFGRIIAQRWPTGLGCTFGSGRASLLLGLFLASSALFVPCPDLSGPVPCPESARSASSSWCRLNLQPFVQ